MRLNKPLKRFLAVSLALLVTFLSITGTPQIALSHARSFVTFALSLQGGLIANNPKPSGRSLFPDVKDHWAQPYIDVLAAKKIIVGYPDGKYYPDNLVKRDEFASIISKAFNAQSKRPSIDFQDVSNQYWAYKGIQSAYQSGFLEGYPDGSFQPDSNIKRVDAIVSLATGLNRVPTSTITLSDYYEDAASIPSYAVNAIAAATEQKVVVNYPDFKRFTPERFATRAEVAAFVYQALVNAGIEKPISECPPGVVCGNSLGSQATSNGVPNNDLKVIITNARELDGKARLVGEEFTVAIRAFDRQKNDLSNIVTLEDSNGNPLGKGASVSYQGKEPKNECLTARLKVGEQQTWDTVCFTVSTKDIRLQDNVKVFDRPEEGENLISVDTDKGFVCFKDDASLQKKIKPEDKLVLFFRPVPTEPTLMPDELITPPIKVGNRIPVSNIYQEPESLPGNTACFEAQEIFALTELVKQADTNYGEMPEIDFISAAPEEDSEDSTGFSRVKDEENPIIDEEGHINGYNSNVIGFTDIKQGWPDGLDEIIEDSNLELDEDGSGTVGLKHKNSLKSLLAQADQKRFGTMSEEPVTKGISSYDYRVTLPLIDEPDNKHQTPGQSIYSSEKRGKRDKCSALFSKENREKSKSLVMLGQLGLNADVRKKLPKAPSLKKVRLNVLVDAAKGLANVKFEGNPAISLFGGISMTGSFSLLDCAETWTLLEKRLPVTIPLPPLPLWIAFYLHIPINVEAKVNASVDNAFIGLAMNAEIGTVKMTLNTLTGKLSDLGWGEPNFSLKPVANGEASLDGYVRVSLEPTIKFLVNEAVGPAVTLAAVVQGNTTPAKTTVNIVQPSQNANYGKSEDIVLSSSVNIEPKISFTQWYEAFIKLHSENEMLAKFNEKFSVLKAGANQICSTDSFKYAKSLISKSGHHFEIGEPPATNNLVVSDVNMEDKLINLSNNEEMLLAYGKYSTDTSIGSDKNLIALRKVKFKKPSWNSVKSSVKSTAGQVAKPVKTVGKTVKQAAKKVATPVREVTKKGKDVVVTVQNIAKQAKDGFCSQTRRITGVDIQKALKEKLTFSAYRWPNEKDSNVACENGADPNTVDCGEYRRFSFLPNKVKKYARKLGTVRFPDIPAGFNRTVWQVDQKVVAITQSKSLEDARQPEFNLGKCALSPGRHLVVATTYSPFDSAQRKPLAASSVPIFVSENCGTPTPTPTPYPTLTPTSTPYPIPY